MKLIGDKKFYKYVLSVAFPIIIQNGVSSFVSMLDNIMVGRVGTEAMSGVSIVNQLVFVMMLCFFGAFGGAGILTAQFYGQKNNEGVRDTFRFKLISGAVLLTIALVIFICFDDQLIGLYLHQSDMEGDLELTLTLAKEYLTITLFGLLPMMIEMCYSSTLRECGETRLPMIASSIAVFVNLILNWILIFGNLGFPVMGAAGAALATVISRFVQMIIVITWSHRHRDKAEFTNKVYAHFHIPAKLMWRVLVLSAPLIVNETLWAAGMATQTQIFSVRGLPVVSAFSINSTIYNVFNIVFLALGNCVGIIVGQQLGAGKVKEGKESAVRIIALSTVISIVIGALLASVSGLFPKIYNTTDQVKEIAAKLILISAVMMPVQGYLHSTYFTVRSGGKTLITFLFDSFFLWVVIIPVAWILTHKTNLDIVYIYLYVQLCDIIKCIVGTIIVKSGIWARNIAENISGENS